LRRLGEKDGPSASPVPLSKLRQTALFPELIGCSGGGDGHERAAAAATDVVA